VCSSCPAPNNEVIVRLVGVGVQMDFNLIDDISNLAELAWQQMITYILTKMNDTPHKAIFWFEELKRGACRGASHDDDDYSLAPRSVSH